MHYLTKTLAIVAVSFFVVSANAQTAYYLDSDAGNDSNQGNSPELAWKTVEKINETPLGPGDQILFRRGGSWTGNFTPKGSGNEEQKIVIGAYGSGPAPVLDARGEIASGEEASYTIRLYNQEYIEVRDLNIKNFKPFEVPEQITDNVFSNSVKMGIYVEGEDCGSLHGISFINLEISDINGAMNTKHNGGIFMKISWNKDPAKRVPSNFVDLLLSDCWIHDVDRTGFSNISEWQNRSLNSNQGDRLTDGKIHNWYPSENVIIRNNRFERSGANALIIRVSNAPLIEHNLFTHCSIKGSGNASFPFNCDDALFQYNEACYTYYNTPADSWNGRKDADAGGFDSDWKCKNTIIQYNYSHHNGFGGALVCCDGNNANGFNDGTILRYNIFEDNRHHIIRVSGTATNTMIYNNLFYSGESPDPRMLIYHKRWNGYSDSVAYHNNIFYSGHPENSINLTESTRNIFNNNLYYGPIENLQDDPNGINANPMFTGTPGSGFGWQSWLVFLLQEGSPAIDKGMKIDGKPLEDFRGMHINGTPDMGPLEFQQQ